ncbi:Uncharacterized protein PSP1 (suppressor of DNA polymerase alpha mutations in yeast) [Phaffia rhodozyma]|uniref:Uncharacterized protein PSP1 (Suppressor of DNA polymerase alpha mutations in yeast) n=1 Tax=Phaffia rhodozyma TaxID=264483 RepID=A0A0F7SRH4_PHARH|nr:Uncharacterized protein PSP1 (suppressor of DNA polymerase alpha mutations in yeast) [Phaffia rhodozyma]
MINSFDLLPSDLWESRPSSPHPPPSLSPPSSSSSSIPSSSHPVSIPSSYAPSNASFPAASSQRVQPSLPKPTLLSNYPAWMAPSGSPASSYERRLSRSPSAGGRVTEGGPWGQSPSYQPSSLNPVSLSTTTSSSSSAHNRDRSGSRPRNSTSPSPGFPQRASFQPENPVSTLEASSTSFFNNSNNNSSDDNNNNNGEPFSTRDEDYDSTPSPRLQINHFPPSRTHSPPHAPPGTSRSRSQSFAPGYGTHRQTDRPAMTGMTHFSVGPLTLGNNWVSSNQPDSTDVFEDDEEDERFPGGRRFDQPIDKTKSSAIGFDRRDMPSSGLGDASNMSPFSRDFQDIMRSNNGSLFEPLKSPNQLTDEFGFGRGALAGYGLDEHGGGVLGLEGTSPPLGGGAGGSGATSRRHSVSVVNRRGFDRGSSGLLEMSLIESTGFANQAGNQILQGGFRSDIQSSRAPTSYPSFIYPGANNSSRNGGGGFTDDEFISSLKKLDVNEDDDLLALASGQHSTNKHYHVPSSTNTFQHPASLPILAPSSPSSFGGSVYQNSLSAASFLRPLPAEGRQLERPGTKSRSASFNGNGSGGGTSTWGGLSAMLNRDEQPDEEISYPRGRGGFSLAPGEGARERDHSMPSSIGLSTGRRLDSPSFRGSPTSPIGYGRSSSTHAVQLPPPLSPSQGGQSGFSPAVGRQSTYLPVQSSVGGFQPFGSSQSQPQGLSARTDFGQTTSSFAPSASLGRMYPPSNAPGGLQPTAYQTPFGGPQRGFVPSIQRSPFQQQPQLSQPQQLSSQSLQQQSHQQPPQQQLQQQQQQQQQQLQLQQGSQHSVPSALYPQGPHHYRQSSSSSSPPSSTTIPAAAVSNSSALLDLGKGLPLHAVPTATKLYIVEFKAGRTDLFYAIDPTQPLAKGDLVIVEADRGKDLGKIINDSISLEEVKQFQEHQAELAFLAQQAGLGNQGGGSGSGGGGGGGGGPSASGQGGVTVRGLAKEIMPKRIYSKAQPLDAQLLATKMQDEAKALWLCQQKVKQKKLPMEVVDAEYQWDRRKLTFYFVAERRIDFRELVREMFRTFKTRIWMACLGGLNGLPQDGPA